MDALELLKDDHKRIKKLLADGAETTEHSYSRRTEIFESLKHEIKVHERREEEVLYPALQTHPKAKDIVLEGYEEHHVADGIISELEATDVADEHWAAKFKVLKENLEHHIEEEEKDMFKKARHIFDEAERAGLGDRMASIRTVSDQHG